MVRGLMAVLYALTVEERSSEEDGGALINREILLLAKTRAEAEEHLDPTDGLMENLTSRITFFVEPVEIVGKQIRRLAS